MSDRQVVEKPKQESTEELMLKEIALLSKDIDRNTKNKIHKDFNKFMKHYALTGENKMSYIKKLFNHYNKWFGVTGEYTKDDLECEDCIKAVTEFWGHIIYGVWKVPIV